MPTGSVAEARPERRRIDFHLNLVTALVVGVLCGHREPGADQGATTVRGGPSAPGYPSLGADFH
jgi:hypothetical protein